MACSFQHTVVFLPVAPLEDSVLSRVVPAAYVLINIEEKGVSKSPLVQRPEEKPTDVLCFYLLVQIKS